MTDLEDNPSVIILEFPKYVKVDETNLTYIKPTLNLRLGNNKLVYRMLDNLYEHFIKILPP